MIARYRALGAAVGALREALEPLVPARDRAAFAKVPGSLLSFVIDRATRPEEDPDEPFDPALFGALVDFYERLEGGFYEATWEGTEHLPREGGVLLVGNHNGGILATEAGLTAAMHRRISPARRFRALAHDVLFADPTVARYARRVGVLRADRVHGASALRAGAAVLVYPGSDLDAVRPYRDRHRIVFGGRTGFAKLAIAAGTPIVPVVATGLHEQLIVLTRGDRLARLLGIHRRARASIFPFALGLPWGVFPAVLPYIPLPTRVTMTACPPIDPAPFGDDASALAEAVRASMQAAMDTAAAGRPFLG